MNTKAIYTVHENGKEHYFFSEHAGGFSYPFPGGRGRTAGIL